jgi:predicted secreted protein
MTRATTANFADMVLEVEFVASSGTYSRVCGLTSRGLDRKANTSSSEVPDCDDETLPSAIEKDIQSYEFTVSGSGVWSSQSHESMLDWFYSGARKNIRIHHVNAEVGDTEYEGGPALLTSLSNQAQRGNKVTADIAIEFDGVPTRTAKS